MATFFPDSFWARRPYSAVLFDMDGTLINSENDTDQSIREVMEMQGIEGAFLPPALTRGRSWRSICRDLCERYDCQWTQEELREALIIRWTERVSQHVEPLTGAMEMLAQASQHIPIAVVSSSPRALIDQLLSACGAAQYVPFDMRVGADNVTHAKPAPECFLLGAERLGVDPERCLVFEDSTAGLQAANAAGMASVAILEVCAQPEECTALATASLDVYTDLTEDFWKQLTHSS